MKQIVKLVEDSTLIVSKVSILLAYDNDPNNKDDSTMLNFFIHFPLIFEEV
ncbi:MAG: hypothetical protein PHS65_03990 [Arcobacteraceae bacterium]|nr:hypothetical protein [Arcobacteraceae bacterium]